MRTKEVWLRVKRQVAAPYSMIRQVLEESPDFVEQYSGVYGLKKWKQTPPGDTVLEEIMKDFVMLATGDPQEL